MNKQYLKYNQIIIEDFSDESIESLYSKGYVMTRLGKGLMDQTRSLRLNIEKFETTSENRRVLRKTKEVEIESVEIPLDKSEYDWKIHKIGKDFYTKKFGDKTFSANKIKELFTTDHNFNQMFRYQRDDSYIGYCVCVNTNKILHYCYPFYRLDIDTRNVGMGMMLKAILWAQRNSKQFVYLGSVQRDSDKYKFQFKGLELWNQTKEAWENVEI